jgi:hypothetical protein
MKEYVKKPESQSRTINRTSKAPETASLHDILQQKRDGSVQREKNEEGVALQKKRYVENSVMQFILDRHQRRHITKYTLTKDFCDKHICEDASKSMVVAKASQRSGVTNSTLIRLNKKGVEEKALNNCLTGEANAQNTQGYGLQIFVRLSNVPVATYNNKTKEYHRTDTGKFIIVGKWNKDKNVEGNHYEGNLTNMPSNDNELMPK